MTATPASAENSASRKSVTVLKLLSGPQLGAEIQLSDGEYLIGGDLDCDVVLADDAVAAQHLNLRLSAGQALIQPRQGEVVIGDRRLTPGSEAALPLGSVMALGASFIAIGVQGTDWLALPLPDLRLARSADPQTAEPAELAPAATAPSTNHGGLPDKAEANGLGAGGVSRSSAGVSPVWGIGALLALLLGVALYYESAVNGAAGNTASATALALTKSPEERLNALLAAEGFKGLDTRLDADGGLLLSGYVETAKDKQRLAALLLGMEVDNRVWADEWVRQAVGDTLERLGAAQLDYQYQSGGGVRLAGYFDGDMMGEELLAVLRNDVPAILKIEADLHTLADAQADLRQRLRSAGLAEQVSVMEDGGRIAAHGLLGPVRMASWRKVASEFVAASGGQPPLASRVSPADGSDGAAPVAASSPARQAASRRAPQLRVNGVMIGRGSPGYALLGNGAMVSEGDLLNGGYRIKRIAFDRIVVGDKSRQWTFYVGQNR